MDANIRDTESAISSEKFQDEDRTERSLEQDAKEDESEDIIVDEEAGDKHVVLSLTRRIRIIQRYRKLIRALGPGCTTEVIIPKFLLCFFT